MGEEAPLAHVLLVSFPAQGHLNPLLRLAKRIAAKGPLVTFSSTLDIGHRIYASTEAVPGAHIPVGKGRLRFEFFSDFWDDDDPRRSDLDVFMPHLRTIGSPAVADLIRRQSHEGHPVTCVINNPFVPWVLDVAEELSIPSAVLWVQSCAVFSTYYHYNHSLVEFPSESNLDVSVTLPGLPTLTADEIPTFLHPNTPYTSLREVILMQFKNIDKASWIFANSFEELERDAIEAVSKHTPMIPIGPLVDADESDRVRGDLWKADDSVELWLSSQKPNSVVYVSVGSVVVLSEEEMGELAYGLRDGGRPFLWVVRQNCRHMLPKGFIEEVEGKGMVVGWSPQEEVLGHEAVACFVTHCGWNSTLEVVAAGRPIVAYPQWGDQVPNAKFIEEVYGVGVRLRAPARREEVEKGIGEVMEGEKAERIRGRVMELKEAARKAVAEGGSSDRNVQAFVDEIVGRACGK